jgi:hypothetical protein
MDEGKARHSISLTSRSLHLTSSFERLQNEQRLWRQPDPADLALARLQLPASPTRRAATGSDAKQRQLCRCRDSQSDAPWGVWVGAGEECGKRHVEVEVFAGPATPTVGRFALMSGNG